MSEDKLLRCTQCGINFIWTSEEQSRHEPPPAYCPLCRRLAPPPGQRRGTVKWFNRSKGFGFITGTDGSEVFVHKSGLGEGQPALRAGQLVQFAVESGPRGVQAVEVTALEAEETGTKAGRD